MQLVQGKSLYIVFNVLKEFREFDRIRNPSFFGSTQLLFMSMFTQPLILSLNLKSSYFPYLSKP